MRRRYLERLGLAAAILFLPGGFVLGTALAARHWRRRRMAQPQAAADARADKR